MKIAYLEDKQLFLEWYSQHEFIKEAHEQIFEEKTISLVLL